MGRRDTEVIAERIDVVERVEELAADYDLEPAEIERAVVYPPLDSAHPRTTLTRTVRVGRAQPRRVREAEVLNGVAASAVYTSL